MSCPVSFARSLWLLAVWRSFDARERSGAVPAGPGRLPELAAAAGAVVGAADLPRSCRAGLGCCRFAETAGIGGFPVVPDGAVAFPGGLLGTEVRRFSCCAGLEPCRFGGDTPAGGGTALPDGRTEPTGGFPAAPDCPLVRREVCSTVVCSECTFSRRVERVSVGRPGALCPGAVPLPGTAAALSGAAARRRAAFSPA